MLPDAGHAVDVPDGVLRQGAAPPLDVAVDGCGQAGAEGLGQVGERDGDELVVGALELGLLPLPADRRAQQEQVGRLGLRPTTTCWR